MYVFMNKKIIVDLRNGRGSVEGNMNLRGRERSKFRFKALHLFHSIRLVNILVHPPSPSSSLQPWHSTLSALVDLFLCYAFYPMPRMPCTSFARCILHPSPWIACDLDPFTVPRFYPSAFKAWLLYPPLFPLFDLDPFSRSHRILLLDFKYSIIFWVDFVWGLTTFVKRLPHFHMGRCTDSFWGLQNSFDHWREHGF